MRPTNPVQALAGAYVRLRPEFRRPCRLCAWDGTTTKDLAQCRPAEQCRGMMAFTAVAIASVVAAAKP